ncbi:hypothetical protein Tco_0908080 [Tanacetum coccineum]|uniref:Reverse transcriptase Ty1/copia-type domain-containing protein n=1 Tax=Tanacetum coccineum TaxID=301880 RepID=A0ABQ5CM91_9ASTR
MEVEGFKPPQEEDIPIRRSERTPRAPNRLSLNVEVEEHSLGDINEPTSYKAAVLDSESNKWIDVMNAEIQSMMDNMVWVLADLPPGCKTVRSKWLFKKKTNMDGIVYTYKARLVAKDMANGYKTTFLNGYLDEDIYMVQPEGFVDPNHPRKWTEELQAKYDANVCLKVNTCCFESFAMECAESPLRMLFFAYSIDEENMLFFAYSIDEEKKNTGLQ